MVLPNVAKGDPHVAAHNAERTEINLSRSDIDAIKDFSEPTLVAAISAFNALRSTYDFVITRSDNTYTATSKDGVSSTFTDVASPPFSGLRAALESCAADGVSIFFPSDLYEFVEDPAGEEDHCPFNGFSFLSLIGSGKGTIISNWRDDSAPGYDTVPDSEPFSMTRCNHLTWRNMRLWAGGNIDANNSSDALDFDGCSEVLVENVLIERSRARGIAMDGGDDGAASSNSTIKNCVIRGVPEKPVITRGSLGTLAAQSYQYCATYVDSVLGETPPSEVNSFDANGTTKNRIYISTGPNYRGKGVTARRIYRRSTGQTVWRRLVSVDDNTTLFYDDNLSDVSISGNPAPPTEAETLIPSEGIKLLGSTRNKAIDNDVIGTNGHGIQIVRKGSAALSHPSSFNKIVNNNVVHAGHGSSLGSMAGIYVGGGSGNLVLGNTIENVGTVTNLGLGVYVQGLEGEFTDNNIVSENHIVDSQSSDSPSGGKTTRYAIQINNTGGTPDIPDSTVLSGNTYEGMQTGDVQVVSGTNTKQFALTTHTHPAAPGGPAPIAPNWRSGLYYGARTTLAHSSISGQALTADQVYAAPVYVPQDVTVTTIACNVATSAGTKLRMGLYTMNATGRPDSLIAGSPTADIAMGPGLKTATISANLTGGTWVWAVVICDGAASITGFSGGQPNLLGSIDPSSGTKYSALRSALGTGWTALPSTFPASPSETAITLNVEVKF